MFRWLRRRRREQIRKRPFPEAWRAILERNVPFYGALSAADRRELEGHALVLLAEKRFEGCGGLRMTDEVRVTIAGQAAVLLLHRDTDYYPRLDSILVYPSAYVAPDRRPGPGGHVIEGTEVRLGESWHEGVVVLAWDEVLAVADDRDGRNVVLHEFAHQLDQEGGAADGAPTFPSRSMRRTWARVLAEEYERLRDDLDRHRRTTIDDYGAEDPAEFFAVITEAFFEKPIALRRRHPDLYGVLRDFYRQDPAACRGAAGSRGDG